MDGLETGSWGCCMSLIPRNRPIDKDTGAGGPHYNERHWHCNTGICMTACVCRGPIPRIPRIPMAQEYGEAGNRRSKERSNPGITGEPGKTRANADANTRKQTGQRASLPTKKVQTKQTATAIANAVTWSLKMRWVLQFV